MSKKNRRTIVYEYESVKNNNRTHVLACPSKGTPEQNRRIHTVRLRNIESKKTGTYVQLQIDPRTYITHPVKDLYK